MRKEKKRIDILNKYYVNTTDISVLLQLPFYKAKAIYKLVDEEEKQKRFRAHELRVPLKSVLRVADVNIAFLRKQVESESEAIV